MLTSPFSASFNSINVKKVFKELISCPASWLIHVCHNSFRKGLSKYENNAEKLCISLFYFFSKSSCRHANLFEMEEFLGLEELVLHCHVQSHWLSLVPALECLVQIKEALKKLLIEELPKQDKHLKDNEKNLDVNKGLESHEIAVEIESIITVKPFFNEFMTKFQKEEPMIHLLHPNCEKLLKTVMGRLLKSKAYTEKKGKALMDIDVDSVQLQLSTDQFKLMQGVYLSFPRVFNIVA